MSRLELGDTPGHPFRGNQYTPGHPFGGREYHLEAHTTYAEARRAGASHEDALDAVYSTHGREVGAMFERTKNLEPPVGRKTAGDAKIGDRVKIVGAELGNEHLIGRTADVRDVRVASRGDDVAKLGNVKDWGMELKGYPLKWLEVQPAATTAAVIERLDRLEAAVLSLARVELGDVAGHPFHGNQWTSGGGATDGRYEGLPMSKLVDKIGSNVNGKDPEHREVLRAALKGPVPSIEENNGKNLALRMAAEMHAAGLSRNGSMTGGEISGVVTSTGSVGFAFGPSYRHPDMVEAHVVLSGKAAGLRYSQDENGEHSPNDPATVRDKIRDVLTSKLGMDVQEVRQTGFQRVFDDDVDYTALVRPPA